MVDNSVAIQQYVVHHDLLFPINSRQGLGIFASDPSPASHKNSKLLI